MYQPAVDSVKKYSITKKNLECFLVLTNTDTEYSIRPFHTIELLFPTDVLLFEHKVSLQNKHKFNTIVIYIHIQLVSVSWFWDIFSEYEKSTLPRYGYLCIFLLINLFFV